jgi:serine/threonine protein kinase
MSPEQARAKELDSRTDLFSFGTVLYEMSTGQPPFQGESTATIFDAILNRAPVAPVRLNPHLPVELEGIINKCLEKDRNLRYQHASEVRADLQRLRRSAESGKAAVVTLQSKGSIGARRRLWSFRAAAVFVAATFLTWRSLRPRTSDAATVHSIAVLPFANAVIGWVYEATGNYKGAIEQWVQNEQTLGNEQRAKEIRQIFEKSGYPGYLRREPSDVLRIEK